MIVNDGQHVRARFVDFAVDESLAISVRLSAPAGLLSRSYSMMSAGVTKPGASERERK